MFIIAFYLLNFEQIKERKDRDFVSVRDVLLEMRKQRMGLIQTPVQLRFSYLAIIEGLKDDWEKLNNVSTLTILFVKSNFIDKCFHIFVILVNLIILLL